MQLGNSPGSFYCSISQCCPMGSSYWIFVGTPHLNKCDISEELWINVTYQKSFAAYILLLIFHIFWIHIKSRHYGTGWYNSTFGLKHCNIWIIIIFFLSDQLNVCCKSFKFFKDFLNIPWRSLPNKFKMVKFLERSLWRVFT